MAPSTKYILTSNDDKQIVLNENSAFLCGVVQDMVKNVDAFDPSIPIPIPNVSGETLEKIGEWLMHYENNPPVSTNDERDSSNMPEWDKEFLNVSQHVLFDIILAANYLNIKVLLENCCKNVANMMKGKTVEELRSHFGIKNDFTPDEEEAIRRENAWCED